MACNTRVGPNAAPMNVLYGTQDLSTKTLPVVPRNLPQHLPLFYIQSERGRPGRSLVNPEELTFIYGDNTFGNTRFSNHQSFYAETTAAEANVMMIHRLTNGVGAGIRLYILIRDEIELDNYLRNDDGSYQTDSEGPITNTTRPLVNGVEFRWALGDASASSLTSPASPTDALPGVSKDTLGKGVSFTHVDSEGIEWTAYPITDLLQHEGAYGNNVGIKLYADPSAINVNDAKENKTYPYTFEILERVNIDSIGKTKPTILGERSPEVNFHPESDSNLSEVVTYGYQNIEDTRYRLLYGDFSDQNHVYQNYVKTVTQIMMGREYEHRYDMDLNTEYDTLSGLQTDLNDSDFINEYSYLINMVNGLDLYGAPYYTVVQSPANAVPQISLTSITPIYAVGGDDKIMNNTDYERAVREDIANYQDCQHVYQDLARGVETFFYDSGFSMDTKLVLGKFISQRPDTYLILQTHSDTRDALGSTPYDPNDEDDQPDDYIFPEVSNLTNAEEIDRADKITNAMSLYPESTYFGTPTVRYVLMSNSMKLRNSTWKERIGLSYYILRRSAARFGAGNGKWKADRNFSRAPRNIITEGYDVNVSWLPTDTRVRYWDAELNFVQTYDYDNLFVPAVQSGYTDDTSVLNGYAPGVCLANLYRVSYEAWREFSGADDLRDVDLRRLVTDFVLNKIDGKYDSQFLIDVSVETTELDSLRGYSWYLIFKLGANNLKTVQQVRIDAYRFDELLAELGG